MDSKLSSQQTYYQLLGISMSASTSQIRDAYKDLARIYHPDSNFYSEIMEGKASDEQMRMFKLITAAYNTLIDGDKRAAYDQLISPLMSGKLKSWEEEEDFFKKNKDAVTEADSGSTPASRARTITGTFGREEILRAMEQEPPPEPGVISNFGDIKPVSEMIQFRQPSNMRTWILIAGGLVAGIILATIALLLLRHR